MVFPVGARRKTAEILSVGYHYFFFGAHLAQPVQLGCTADFEQFWPILGPKFNRIMNIVLLGIGIPWCPTPEKNIETMPCWGKKIAQRIASWTWDMTHERALSPADLFGGKAPVGALIGLLERIR